MALEIERKFLVADPGVLEGREGTTIAQGYLPVETPLSVRIRLRQGSAGEEAFLTLKRGQSALVRSEFEYSIPTSDAEAMLEEMCGEARVRKTRFEIEYRGHLWEVDRFEGENAPLVMAEIELDAADRAFDLPPWVGVEVTEDVRLHNSNLCRHPLAHWTQAERAALLGS